MKIPTIFTPTANGKSTITTREYIALGRIQLTEASITPSALARTLSLIQDLIREATKVFRSDPMAVYAIAEKVVLVNGQTTAIRHGLGTAWAWYVPLRAYNKPNVAAASAPFAAVDAPSNANMDPTQFLALLAGASGTYDIAIYPG